jgi:anti-anti-sigma factor
MTSNTRQFRISVYHEIGYTRLVAAGRLVLGQGADIALWLPYLTTAAGRTIEVDLKGVTDIDARGLGLLLELAYCADAGSSLHFVGASPRVMRLVRLTRLHTQLSFRARRACSIPRLSAWMAPGLLRDTPLAQTLSSAT